MFRRLWVLFFLFIITVSSFAQLRNIRINSIVIEGNKEAEASSIRLNSGLLVGNEITGEELQKAVKNLWALGLFSDVQIYVTNQTSTGMDLLLRVKEYPRLNKVKISGNDEFDTDELEDELTVYKRMIVSDYRLFKIKQIIKKMYLEEGFCWWRFPWILPPYLPELWILILILLKGMKYKLKV